MSRPIPLADILGNPERNGLYRLADGKALPEAIAVAGKHLTGKSAMLKAIAKALAFPDYFGHNWDALEECLTDLSWHQGAVALSIDEAGMPEQKAPEDWATMLDILADAACYWQAEGRPFAVFLHGGHSAYPLIAT